MSQAWGQAQQKMIAGSWRGRSESSDEAETQEIAATAAQTQQEQKESISEAGFTTPVSKVRKLNSADSLVVNEDTGRSGQVTGVTPGFEGLAISDARQVEQDTPKAESSQVKHHLWCSSGECAITYTI